MEGALERVRQSKLLREGGDAPLTTTASPEGPAKDATRAQRNVRVLSIAFLLNFIGFGGVQTLTSSSLGTVGLVSLACVYASFTACCTAGPRFVQILGVTGALRRAMLVFSTYCAASTVAVATDSEALHYALLIPASLALGAAASALWTAQGVAVTFWATEAAVAQQQAPSSVLGSFNGQFFAVMSAFQLVSNLFAGLLLSVLPEDDGEPVLFACFLASCVAGTATVGLLDPVRARVGEEGGEEAAEESAAASLLRTLRLAQRSATLRHLIPLLLYWGAQQGWAWGVFTADVVSERLGIESVGFVMAFYGGASMLFSGAAGAVSDRVGRGPPLLAAAVFHWAVAGALLALDLDDYSDSTLWVLLCACALAWGVGDAVFNTVNSAVIGESFEDKSTAFANAKAYQSLGTALVFGLTSSFSLSGSLGCQVGLLGVAVVGWVSRPGPAVGGGGTGSSV